MPPARLAAHDLACRRGDRILFRGLSFALGAGEALHLEGPNGIGKSSLLRLIAGLARPFAGHVTREGAIGLIDERPALDPERPLAQALAFWSGIDGSAPDATSRIERLGLADLLDVPVRYLSTGQRKRAALARLLGQEAPIWLLDEPLNGLDVQAARLLEELTAEHCRAGGIALIASHQPFHIAQLSKLALADFAA